MCIGKVYSYSQQLRNRDLTAQGRAQSMYVYIMCLPRCSVTHLYKTHCKGTGTLFWAGFIYIHTSFCTLHRHGHQLSRTTEPRLHTEHTALLTERGRRRHGGLRHSCRLTASSCIFTFSTAFIKGGLREYSPPRGRERESSERDGAAAGTSRSTGIHLAGRCAGAVSFLSRGGVLPCEASPSTSPSPRPRYLPQRWW